MKFSIFEALMLICFGASWPFAIIKTIRAKNPAGKSYLFSVLVIIGYMPSQDSLPLGSGVLSVSYTAGLGQH